MQACAKHGCTEQTCRYYRGCVLFTLKSFIPSDSSQDLHVQWRSLAELAGLHKHRLVQAACTYDREEKILFAGNQRH